MKMQELPDLKLNGLLQNDKKENKEKDQNFLSKLTLKCPYNKNGLFYCYSCDNCAVSCGDQDCKCQIDHEKCQNFKKIKTFHKQLESKLKKTQLFQKTTNEIDKLINHLYVLQNTLQKQFKYFGLNSVQKDLVDRIISYNEDPKNQIKNFQDSLKQINLIRQTWIYQQIEKFEKIQSRYQKIIRSGLNQIFNNIKLKYYKLQVIFKQIQTNILRKQKQKQKMFKILIQNNKQINKIQRIYCASKDSFNVQSFHQKCDNKPNLIYLVQNQFDKKYGAYCPCPISKERKKKWQIDQSMKSFIFSIDKNIKANLAKKQFAINNGYKSKTHSSFVYFGQPKGCNLVISEKSNQQQRDNWIHFYGDAYQQKQYNSIEVNGNQTDKVKLKQFQVFQITWQNKQ